MDLGQKNPLNTSDFARDYETYKIERLARRGLYEINDSAGNFIAVFPRLVDCRKFIDKQIAKAGK